MSKGIDLSGLDQFNSSSFLQDIDQEAASSGKPLLVPLDQIKPDPHQPRQEIDAERLEELAASIRERGVKSPISLKPKNEDGIYFINHGERRFHAARNAGLTEIPAFIDDDHNHYDQMIENIQRENLTPLEIAHFIERRLEAGDKKGQIAKILGKPASYISDHAVFFEFSDFIRDLYDSGRCRSIQALALLHRACKEFPVQVAGFCAGEREITTAEVRGFVTGLKSVAPSPVAGTITPLVPPAPAAPVETEGQDKPQAAASPAVQGGAPAAEVSKPKPVLKVAAPAAPAPETTSSDTPKPVPAELAPALYEQLDRFLAPLESYLQEVSDAGFREVAAEKLRELAAKFSR